MRRIRSRCLIWLILLCIAAVAGGIALATHRNSTRRLGASNAVVQPVMMIGQVLAPDPERVFGSNHLRVLVVGLDYDYDAKDQQTSRSSRSDIIMAVSLDFRRRRVFELSVPRDMVATLPNGRQAKINQAQSEGGIRESEAVVADWLGIPGFDRHIVLRIDATTDLINAIGGIDVDVKNSDALQHAGINGPLDYDDSWGHLHVHLKPGLQHLGGSQAVGYARFRHDWCSDPCRIMRQQQVIRAFVDKIQHSHFNTIIHAGALLDVVRKDVDTNLTPSEELALLMAFAHVGSGDIRTAQVPYVASVALPDYGDSIVPDEAKKRELASMLLAPEELALEKISPAVVHVTVLNGTGVPGLAGHFAQQLQDKGFIITRIGDAPQPADSTQILGTASTSRAAQLVQRSIGMTPPAIASSPASDERGRDDVTIVLGRDVTRSIAKSAALTYRETRSKCAFKMKEGPETSQPLRGLLLLVSADPRLSCSRGRSNAAWIDLHARPHRTRQRNGTQIRSF